MTFHLNANPNSDFAKYLPVELNDADTDAVLDAAIRLYNDHHVLRPIYADMYTDEIFLRYKNDNRRCPARYVAE